MSKEVKIRRHIFLCTSDQQEAFDEMKKQKAKGERLVSMADTRNMLDPPKTRERFVVFKLVEEYL